MKGYKKILSVLFQKITAKNICLGLSKVILLLLLMSFSAKSLHAQSSKIQQSIDAIKAAYYCEDEDYHTDGKRTVWVKSYKKWTPTDLITLKKNAPDVLRFLIQAIQHNRIDVLEQLLPDFYYTHGNVQTFAIDIQKTASEAK